MRKHAAFLSCSGALLVVACATRNATPLGQQAPPVQEAKVVEAPPTVQAPPTEPAPIVDAPKTVETPPVQAAAPPASKVVPPPPRTRKAPPQTQRDCKACNGDWGIHGLSSKPSCNCRTTDGGKRCRDGAECQGLCTASDDPEREVTDRGPPARGYFIGRCSNFTAIFGCYRPLDDGASANPVDLTEAPQMLCAD